MELLLGDDYRDAGDPCECPVNARMGATHAYLEGGVSCFGFGGSTGSNYVNKSASIGDV